MPNRVSPFPTIRSPCYSHNNGNEKGMTMSLQAAMIVINELMGFISTI
jgi:hypothetical protein